MSWQGDADIVTSNFTDSGGLWASGTGTMRVINSLVRPQSSGTTLNGWDGFLVNLGGRLEFEASTVLIHVNECPVRDDRGNCNLSGVRGSTATFFSNNNSVINFKQSAIHVQTLNPIFSPSQTPWLEALNGGAFTADQYTFIQPLDWQDASALNALVTTTGGTLITVPGALPATNTNLGTFAFDFPEIMIPIISGPLEGAIPNADTTNLLRDPRGSVIDFDILGASRNTGPERSIGAVEGGPLYLAALIEPSTPFTADLSWSKPLSATGYDLCQGVGTPPGGLAGTTTACPSNFTPGFSTNRDTVSGKVSNLPPDSETHWFLVRATDSGTPGLWSNVQVVTVPVTITYPPTVIGTSNLVSPVVTGLLVNPTYLPLLGALPSGFTLDPTAGALSRTATGTCTPSVIGILVIAGSGDVTSTSASFSCPVSVPASAPVLSYPNSTTLYENSAGNIVTPKVVGLLATGTPNFTLTSGTLPAGLTLDPATGVISGDLGVGTANTYSLQVQVTQSGLPTGISNSFVFLIVGGAPSPQLSYPDVDVPAGTTGLVITPTISGFTNPPIFFQLLSGSQLPAGLVLDQSTGVVSGIPLTATDGIISWDISATNGTQTRVSFLNIQVQPTLNYPATIGKVGDPLSILPIISPSAVLGTFSVTSGALPSGLTLDPATGVISGTPLNAGQVGQLAVTYTQTGGQTQLVTANVNITVQSVGSPAAIPSLPIGGIVLLVAAIAWIGARKFRPKGGAV